MKGMECVSMMGREDASVVGRCLYGRKGRCQCDWVSA